MLHDLCHTSSRNLVRQNIFCDIVILGVLCEMAERQRNLDTLLSDIDIDTAIIAVGEKVYDKQSESAGSIDADVKNRLQDLLLPEDFENILHVLEDKKVLQATVGHLTVSNLKIWLQDFEAIHCMTLRVKAIKKATKGYVLQHYYRCQHNTGLWSPSKDPQQKLASNPAARVKNTNCPFSLTVKIDMQNVGHINLNWNHNHSTRNLEACNFGSVSEESRLALEKLYKEGHTPASAREVFVTSLREKCVNELDFHLKKADRSVMPRRRDFKYFYTQFTKTAYGGLDENMYIKLVDQLEELNKQPGTSVRYQLFGGPQCPLIIAMVTPLMQRTALHIPQSHELMFVDATSSTEEHNLKLFLLCTHSIAGALPLGNIITSDEKEVTMKKGFTMLKDCLPEAAFFGRGRDLGPQIILTDNCKEEQSALHHVWPMATYLLCAFYILQQTWRWLMEKKHGIAEKDRPRYFCQFKNAMYAKSSELFHERYEELLDDLTEAENDKALEYFMKLYGQRKEFALCFRAGCPTRGNHTNNFVEAQFLQLKDVILHRTKEYNVVALVSRLTKDLKRHYKDKLLSIADGSYDSHYRNRFMGRRKTANDSVGNTIPGAEERHRIVGSSRDMGNHIFEVDSFSEEGMSYTVDMALGTCTCDMGRDGAPCKHQYALWCGNKASCLNFLPVHSPEMRQMLVFIAIGQSLGMDHYTTIRQNEPQNSITSQANIPAQESTPHSSADLFGNANDHENSTKVDSAISAIQEVCNLVAEKLKQGGDANLAEGVLKFHRRVMQLDSASAGCAGLTTAFFGFASHEMRRGKNGRKIKVQPNRKRKSGIGSRQAVSKIKRKALVPLGLPAKQQKRVHRLSSLVNNNVNVAKMSGADVMASKTKHTSVSKNKTPNEK